MLLVMLQSLCFHNNSVNTEIHRRARKNSAEYQDNFSFIDANTLKIALFIYSTVTGSYVNLL